MTSRGRHLTAACVLIVVTRVFMVQTLTCHLTEYRIGDRCCSLCVPGRRVEADCTESRRTSCVGCTTGTYMDRHNGQKQCSPCTTCDSGSGLKVKWPCEQTSDAVCEPVQGFFCINSTIHGCAEAQKHKSCGPGQFIRDKGTDSTDTQCSDCSRGTFSDGSLTSCRPHTQCETNKLQMIKAGTASTDAECGEESFSVMGAVFGSLILFLVVVTLVSSYVLTRRDNALKLRDKVLELSKSHVKSDGGMLTQGSQMMSADVEGDELEGRSC